MLAGTRSPLPALPREPLTAAVRQVLGAAPGVFRSDGVFRQSADGSGWGEPGKSPGDLPTIPPSGRAGRPVRITIMQSRGDPDTMDDPGIDDLRCQLIITPRVIEVPQPGP